MPEQDNKDLLDFAMRSNLMQGEAELRNSWYNHVLHSLEKLDTHLDKLTVEVYSQRDEFRKELHALQEKLRSESVDVRSLSILEKHIEDLICKLDRRLMVVESSDNIETIRLDLDVVRAEVKRYKEEWTNQITISSQALKAELTKESVSAIRKIERSVLKLQVKAEVIRACCYLAGTGIIAFLVHVIRSQLIGGGTP